MFRDLTRTAVLSTTVPMGFRPAAFIVSPDSNVGELTGYIQGVNKKKKAQHECESRKDRLKKRKKMEHTH